MSFDLNHIPKSHLAIAGGVLGTIILLVIIVSWMHTSKTTSTLSPEEASRILDMNAPKENYFRNSSPTTTSAEDPNLKEKLVERGQMQELTLGFARDGFRETPTETAGGIITLRASAMVQFELDTSETGLPEGTVLSLAAP